MIQRSEGLFFHYTDHVPQVTCYRKNHLLEIQEGKKMSATLWLGNTTLKLGKRY